MSSNYLRFLYFYHADWADDEVYTLNDFGVIYDMEIRLVRYYLMRLVKERKLCQIKHGIITYYAKHWTGEVFSQLNNVSVIR